jgi:valyl-tRNA synthetase
VTGFDIIFFWVARMTMMAGHFTGKMPFSTVYIHGLVRDENNQKMSKSKGNGIDPLLLINKYGTDALRYTLIREVAGAGQDIRLEYDRNTDESVSVEASRNFTNKLWNAARFVMMNLQGKTPAQLGNPIENDALELSDRWILSRFYRTVQQARQDMDAYGMGEAAKALYEFTWGDFCDWYIELVKSRLQDDTDSKLAAQQTLAFVLDGILKLLHPFMPHITEEIWHTLNQVDEDADCLAVQPYPTVQSDWINDSLEEQFELLIGTVRVLRNLRAEAGIKPSVKVTAVLQSEKARERDILAATETYIQDLARVETLQLLESAAEAPQQQTIAGVVGTVQVLIPLSGVVDVAILRGKLEKDLGKVEAEIKSLSGRLSNPGFVNKAPDHVVQGARDSLAESEKQAEILRDRLGRL